MYQSDRDGRVLRGEPADGIPVAKGSDLIPAINAGIAALKADGTLDQLTQKWFVDYKPAAQ